MRVGAANDARLAASRQELPHHTLPVDLIRFALIPDRVGKHLRVGDDRRPGGIVSELLPAFGVCRRMIVLDQAAGLAHRGRQQVRSLEGGIFGAEQVIDPVGKIDVLVVVEPGRPGKEVFRSNPIAEAAPVLGLRGPPGS